MRRIFLLLMSMWIVEGSNDSDVTFSQHKDAMISDFTKIRNGEKFFWVHFSYEIDHLMYNMNFPHKFKICPSGIKSAIQEINELHHEMTADPDSGVDHFTHPIRDYTLTPSRLILSTLQKLWAFILYPDIGDKTDHFLKAFYRGTDKMCNGYRVSTQQRVYQLYTLISRTILFAKATVYTAYGKWLRNETLSEGRYRTYLIDAEEFFDDDFELYDKKIPHVISIASNVISPCYAINSHHLQSQKINRVSLASQTSNIRENMVITGVQLFRNPYNQILHLRVKEGKIQVAGMVEQSYNVPQREESQNSVQSNRQISGTSNLFYLDDIILPENHVVTGVRFKQRFDNDMVQSFELEVRSTPYDFSTGELEQNEDRSEWISSANIPERTVVELKTPGQSTNANINSVSEYDSRMVETNPSFPLSGVGLFVSNRVDKKFLALHLYTFNVARHVLLRNDPRNFYNTV